MKQHHHSRKGGGGMLSGDNIHPSELGAQALASRVLCDFPEIAAQ